MFYKTVSAYANDEFIERRSRFIGHIAPVKTEEEAQTFLQEMRTKYWDASHNCFAYRLREGGIMRFSDDGEPQGTAGTPILDVLTREDITDAIIVVTRYFGGTLLGAGGLIRAYAHGAKLAVDAADILEMHTCVQLRLRFAYDLYGKISYLLPRFGALIQQSDFTDAVTLTLLLKEEQQNPLCAQLVELTGGQIELEEQERLFAPM